VLKISFPCPPPKKKIVAALWLGKARGSNLPDWCQTASYSPVSWQTRFETLPRQRVHGTSSTKEEIINSTCCLPWAKFLTLVAQPRASAVAWWAVCLRVCCSESTFCQLIQMLYSETIVNACRRMPFVFQLLLPVSTAHLHTHGLCSTSFTQTNRLILFSY